jgi:flagellar basal body rod protein FlgB
MMRTALIADNISDVLVKIIHFTQLRRQVLHENLHKAGNPVFMPKDLPVREFAEALNGAVAEHLQNRRLLFRDTSNIKFGPNNTMEAWPVADPHAHALLQTSRDEYTELQINKLLENCLNRRVAEELLRQKCGVPTPVGDGDLGNSLAGNRPLGDLPPDRDTAE